MYFSESFINVMILISLGIITASVIVLVSLLIADYLNKKVW